MSEERSSCSSHSQRSGVGGVAKSESKWRQSPLNEVEKTIAGQTSPRDEESGHAGVNASGNSTVLKQKNCDFSDSSETSNIQNTYSSSMESETGLYIHSSVRSGGSGIRFSRQVSADRQTGLPPNHHPSHHNQSREHGKLFKVLQKFSNKRAQQRVEVESEKRARKSPQHGGGRTERGREKENVGHQKRSHKSKQGKKGRFPVSKSSDLLSGFSDVVYQDNPELDPLELEVESDPLLIYANTTSEWLLGDQLSSQSSAGGWSHVHHNGSRGQKYRSMPPSCDVEDDDYDSTSRFTRASVRRTNSLNDGVYHRCSVAMDTGVYPKSAVSGLSRNGSKKKSHDSLLCQGESRDSP